MSPEDENTQPHEEPREVAADTGFPKRLTRWLGCWWVVVGVAAAGSMLTPIAAGFAASSTSTSNHYSGIGFLVLIFVLPFYVAVAFAAYAVFAAVGSSTLRLCPEHYQVVAAPFG
jgi:hypothetical protein